MGNFKQNNKPGGRGNDRGFGRDSATMHRAVCSQCGKDCEVPFKPTGDKPIFCNDCFRNKRSSEPRRFGGRDSGRFGSSDKRMYKVVCDKCGKECEVPFKPTGDKPVYCKECFDRGGRDRSSGQGNRQLEMINVKLDKILKALNITDSVKTEEKKKIVKKTEVSKPKKVSKGKAKKAVLPKKAKVKAKVKTKAKAKKKK